MASCTLDSRYRDHLKRKGVQMGEAGRALSTRVTVSFLAVAAECSRPEGLTVWLEKMGALSANASGEVLEKELGRGWPRGRGGREGPQAQKA